MRSVAGQILLFQAQLKAFNLKNKLNSELANSQKLPRGVCGTNHLSPHPHLSSLPFSAVELAMIMDRLYGGVCYAGIDTDPELKYPKGAGRVAFSNQQSYIAAISARFVQLQHNDIDKRVSEFVSFVSFVHSDPSSEREQRLDHK